MVTIKCIKASQVIKMHKVSHGHYSVELHMKVDPCLLRLLKSTSIHNVMALTLSTFCSSNTLKKILELVSCQESNEATKQNNCINESSAQ